MRYREARNSTILRRRFPEVYTTFFHRCQAVVSTSAEVPLLSDHNSVFRGVAIKQRIALDVLVGYGNDETSTLTYYDDSLDDFVVDDITNLYPEAPQVLKLVQQYAGQNWPSIHILLEAPKSVGFSVRSKIGLLLAYLSLGQKIINFTPTIIHDLLHKAISLLHILGPRDIDFTGLFAPFLDVSAPHYIMQPEVWYHLSNYDTVRYGSCLSPCNALDYYYVFSGQKRSPADYHHLIRQQQSLVDDYLHNLQEWPGPLTTSLYKDIDNLLYQLSFRIYSEFQNYLDDPTSHYKFLRFTNSLQQYTSLRSSLDTEPQDEMRQIATEISLGLAKRHFTDFSITNNGNPRSGCLTILTERDKGRALFAEAFNDVKERFPYLSLAYISFIDGSGGHGLQWEKETPTPTTKTTSPLVICDQKGQQQELIAYDWKQLSYELIFDAVAERVVINNQPVNSHDLHSQRMTIEIFKRLLQHPGQDIPNSELPKSSYTSSKNEFTGKILLPLKRLLKRLGKELPLCCHGSHTNFFLRLDPSDLSIGLIRYR